jgi:hypothetical protein
MISLIYLKTNRILENKVLKNRKTSFDFILENIFLRSTNTCKWKIFKVTLGLRLHQV